MMSLVRLTAIVTLLAGGAWTWSLDRTEPSDLVGQVASSADTALWLAPDADPVASTALARGVALVAEGQAAQALPLLSAAAADPVVAPYMRLHRGQAQLALDRPDEAAQAARSVIESSPGGYLGESALWLLAESLDAAEAWTESVGTWQAIAGLPIGRQATVQLRLGQAAEKVGNRALAHDAYSRVYFEWPTSSEAAEAETALARFPASRAADTVSLELTRAARLYSARRYAEARRAFEQVHGRTTGDERMLVDLRLAQCDVLRQQFTRGLSALTTYLARPQAVARPEAGYYVLAALRGLKRADYPARVARFASEHPDSSFAEAALNDLATYYILADDDAGAARVFTDMYARYPKGDFADRAAWRAGWWAYRQGNDRETIRLFESAAMAMGRADSRPGWLYWAARAHERRGERDAARLWYIRTIADYRNSYYGREASRAFRTMTGSLPPQAEVAAERDPARAVTAGPLPGNATLVQRLLAVGLWDDAVGELRHEQATTGSTPVIEATIAYALNRKGALRPAINAMRRAYPQFMSDGGEQLPERILKVIFPVAHWDTIGRHAASRKLDLYLVAALVAQESTFQADVVSSANAVGLMQLLPATGRRYAVKVGLSGFSPASLTQPDVNVRLGTAYLSELLTRYGGEVAPALAAYNAGENRVDRWRRERPGLPRDEFVDDIPFPETQNYVKRIIGTAEDYRLLYGTGSAADQDPNQ